MEEGSDASPPAGSQGGATARIAVIVPAYGVADLLPQALRSLQAQTLADWECVVVDDGAPDDVAGAVAPFLPDLRIRFLATSNQGVSSARNRAIAACAAPLLSLLDGDDLYRPDYLANVVRQLDSDPQAKLVTCNARVFGAVERDALVVNRTQRPTGTLADVLDRSFNVYIGSAFRRADFLAIGGFDETMTHAEDLDLWVRLLIGGGHARYIGRVLGEYRVRANSASAHDKRMLQGNLRVYEKACALLEGRAEQPLAQALIEQTQQALELLGAQQRVIDGDLADGLKELRRASSANRQMIWRLSFALWRIVPQLAPPMLRWRQKAHSRGGSGGYVPSLMETAA